MTEKLNTIVRMKHTDGAGAILWNREHLTTSRAAADVRMEVDDGKALITWPEGLVLFSLRPGERIEIYSTEEDE